MSYQIVNRGAVRLANLRPCFVYNASRDGAKGLDQLFGITGKVPTMHTASVDLLQSILIREWDRAEKFVITTLQSSDVETVKAEQRKLREDLLTYPFFKGEVGTFFVNETEVKITRADIVAEYDLTWGGEVSTDTKAVISGNRGCTMLATVANAIRRKAGLAPIMSIDAEERKYANRNEQDDDSITMNELAHAGKLETSNVEKFGAAFKAVYERGAIQTHLNVIFAANRGVVQLMWAIVACVIRLSWAKELVFEGKEMSGAQAMQIIKGRYLDGSFQLPNQGRLARLRGLLMETEHSDGHTLEFRTANKSKKKPDTHLGQNAFMAFKANCLKHPETTQRIADYLVGLNTKGWVDAESGSKAKVSSMASSDIQGLASNVSDEKVSKLLAVVAGVDETISLAEAVQALQQELGAKVDPIFLRDAEGVLTGSPATQEDFDRLMTTILGLEAKVLELEAELEAKATPKAKPKARRK